MGGNRTSAHDNTVTGRVTFSTGPPSIDRQPKPRTSAVSTPTSRGRAPLEGQRRLAVLAAPLCSCTLGHNHLTHLTDDTSVGTHISHFTVRCNFQKMPRGTGGPVR